MCREYENVNDLCKWNARRRDADAMTFDKMGLAIDNGNRGRVEVGW